MPDTLAPDLGLPDAARHGIGGNQAPEAIDLLRTELAEADSDALKRLIADAVALLEGAVTRAFVVDEEFHARLVDAAATWRKRTSFADEVKAEVGTNFIAIVDRETERLEAEKAAIGKPFFNAHRKVTGHFNALAEPLVAGRKHVDRLAQAWLAAQRERAKAEAATKLREAEAAAKAGDTEAAATAATTAAALMQEPARVRTEHGALASGRQGFDVEIIDATLVPREFLVPDLALIKAAVNRRGIREIPGVKITEIVRTRYTKGA